MIKIVLIDREGQLTEKNVKGVDKLWGVCKYRNETHFEQLHQWEDGVELHGKRVGKSNYLNTVKFPAPLEHDLFYGTMCLIKRNPTTKDVEPFTLQQAQQFLSFEPSVLNTVASATPPTIETTDDKELGHEEYEPE
jgi:hypothetical protein